MISSSSRRVSLLALLLVALCALTTFAVASPTPEDSESPLVRRSLQDSSYSSSKRGSTGAGVESRNADSQQSSHRRLQKRSYGAAGAGLARTPLGSVPSRPRLMPFPALDEPLRRAGGLMNAFKS